MSSFSKKRVLEILDQAQEGDNFSKLIDRCLGGLIVLNILAVSLESIEYLGVARHTGRNFSISNIFRILVFASRISYFESGQVPSVNASRFHIRDGPKARIYYSAFNGLIDLLAIVPSIISLFVGNVDLRWVRVITAA